MGIRCVLTDIKRAILLWVSGVCIAVYGMVYNPDLYHWVLFATTNPAHKLCATHKLFSTVCTTFTRLTHIACTIKAASCLGIQALLYFSDCCAQVGIEP